MQDFKNIYSKDLEKEVKKQLNELREKDKLLIAQSKLAAVGETLAHIAHQWKQPLSQINSVVLGIETDFEDDKLTKKKLEKHLNEIEKLTFYMSDTIQSFNNYLQPNKEKTIFCITEAFDDSFRLVSNLLKSKNIKYTVNIQSDYYARGVQKEFVQALLVILNNAKDVLVHREIKNKQISIEIYKKYNKINISIKDNAGGIKEKHLDKIFDPYFTTKTHSQGTGHGLCMAKMIIEKSMHGTLNINNEKDGANFCITLTSKNKNA